MKFSKLTHPALCAADEQTRYGINGVACVTGPDGKLYLTATDGHIASLIVATPEDCDHVDPNAIYPTEPFRIALKNTMRSQGEASVQLNGKAVVKTKGGGITEHQAITNQIFPDVWGCIPKNENAQAVLRLNAVNLARLARALGTESVELTVHDSEGLPIRVTPILGEAPNDGSFGIIMPIAADDSPRPNRMLQLAQHVLDLLRQPTPSNEAWGFMCNVAESARNLSLVGDNS